MKTNKLYLYESCDRMQTHANDATDANVCETCDLCETCPYHNHIHYHNHNHSQLKVEEENSQNIRFTSVFENRNNIIPIGNIDVFDFIASDKYRKRVEGIRMCNDPKKIKFLKSKLPAITPSGIFTERCNLAIVKHSGLICIDIDGKDNPNIKDWEAFKDSISDINGLCYAGLSASGKGVFLILNIAYPEKHPAHFYALEHDLSQRGIKVDAACKDVSRLRFASYDARPFINRNAIQYTKVLTPKQPKEERYKPQTTNITLYRVGLLVEKIERNRLNIADYYPDWFSIGCALANEFGEQGRDIFHVISRQSEKYNFEECNYQYSKCIEKSCKVKIDTFFWYCKRHGITTN